MVVLGMSRLQRVGYVTGFMGSWGIWCHRSHEYGCLRWRGTSGPERHSLGDWVMCGVVRSDGVLAVLLAVGVVALSGEGRWAWRLRFWRASKLRAGAAASLWARVREGGW